MPALPLAHDHPVEGDAHVEGLGEDLVGAGDIAQRAHGVGAAAGDDVGRAGPGAARSAADRLHRRVQVGPRWHDLDPFDAHQAEQEVVAARVRLVAAGDALLEHQAALEALARRGGQGEAAMVGLRRADGDQGVGALGEGVGDQELQLAGLVAARRQAQGVVALDPDFRPAQRLREVRQRLDRRRVRRVPSAGKPRQIHA